MCMGQTWYLSVDMQLYVLSPIILIPLWKWPKWTLLGSTVLVLGSIAIDFAITYVQDLPGLSADSASAEWKNNYYYVTHARYGPWFMGLMLGYYLFKISLHPTLIAFGWIAAMGLLLSTLFAGHDLVLHHNKLGSSFFNGFHRHGWALGLCWVIYACTQGYGGPVNAFLSWSLFQILGRFTYTIYLVHVTMQGLIICTARTPTYFSDFRTAFNLQDLEDALAGRADVPGLEKCKQSFQMFDASGKLPSGLLSGNLKDLGNFDQCINTTTPVKAQYCTVILRIPAELLQQVEGRPMMRGMDGDNSTGLMLGWCLPHTCPINELTAALSTTLEDLEPGLKVTPFMGGLCQTKDDLVNKYDTGKIIVITFLAATLFLMVISTLYDMYLQYNKKKPVHIILIAFSARTNGQKLLTTSKNADQLGCLNGIRFISMMWVILGHRYTVAISENNINPMDILELANKPENMYIINAPLSVDSFFVLSGLLIAYTYCLAMEKGVNFNIILFYVHRYLRLTPVLAVVVWIHVTILDLFGSGPHWLLVNSTFKTPCVNNWWSALVYVQNYYNPHERCIGQSWYLSVDMQLYVLSPIILIPLWKWPKWTLFGSTVLVLGSTAIGFVITYVQDLPAFVVTQVNNSDKYVSNYYYATHARYGPWLMGLMLGYYLFKLKKNKNNRISLHPVKISFGWIVAMGLLLSTLFAGHDLVLNHNKLGSSFFNGFHRHGWALGLCWVIYACTQGYGGPINAFLSWSLFQILGRFTYTMYLVHGTFQILILLSSRTLTHFSQFQTMYVFWGDLVISFAIAVCLTLAYESPMVTIEKVLFKTGHKPKKQELPSHNPTSSENGHTNKGFERD